jgi:hypothetical protein
MCVGFQNSATQLTRRVALSSNIVNIHPFSYTSSHPTMIPPSLHPPFFSPPHPMHPPLPCHCPTTTSTSTSIGISSHFHQNPHLMQNQLSVNSFIIVIHRLMYIVHLYYRLNLVVFDHAANIWEHCRSGDAAGCMSQRDNP